MKGHGKDTYFEVNGNDVSESFTGAKLNRTKDKVELTCFGQDDKTYKSGVKGCTISLDGYFDTIVNGYLKVAYNTDESTYVYGPLGNAVGMPKFSGSIVVDNYDISGQVDGAVAASFGATQTGPEVETVF